MRKVFDTFLFYNELELLELRLNTLSESVDYFVITEAKVTFSGKPKPLFYSENKERFKSFENKIIHNIVENTPVDFDKFIYPNDFYTKRDVSYPHKSNGVPLSLLNQDFQREVFQRDSIINGLIGKASLEDLVIISDLDEIPNPKALNRLFNEFKPETVYTFQQKWFMYYFNVFCDAEWFGTRVCDFATLKKSSVDLMRYHLESRDAQPGPVIENGGWHFSFLGGAERVREKLDAYSYQGRRSKLILKLLDKLFPWRIKRKIQGNKDIFSKGRKFSTVLINDSFPEFLLKNLDRYKSMIKN